MSSCSFNGLFFPSIVCVLAASGCGTDAGLAPIAGVVSYKGEPLKFGSVMFQPKGGGELARGNIQSDGSFTLNTGAQPGAADGTYTVRVACFSGQDPSATAAAGNDEPSLGKSLIPERYSRFTTSGLTVEIKSADSQTYNLELTDR